jgi:hypothetical protein
MDEPTTSELDTPTDERVRSGRRRTTKVIRIGGVICLVGLAITVFGNVQISRASSYVPPEVHATRGIGLLLMLVGFLVILSGYRIPWFLEVTNRMRASTKDTSADLDNSTTRSAERGRRNPNPNRPWIANTSLLLGYTGIVTISIVFVYLVPDSLAGLYITIFTLALTTAAVVTIVYGRGYQRTFAIGCVIPLMIAAWNVASNVLPIFATQMSMVTRVTFSGRYGDYWDGDARLLFDWFELVGTTTRLAMSALWIVAACLGAFAVLVRLGLHLLNAQSSGSSDRRAG